MLAPARNSRVVQFGVFEADLQESELRKSGIRIKLQEQPFQILKILLEHPGQTVTREELRERLWPADTFVDFDHSLNSSIKKLREALGDDSDNPRFIETLHRRGYRFIAPVNGRSSVVLQPIKPPPTAHGRNSFFALAGVALVIVLVIVYWLARPLPSPRVMNATQLTNDGRDKWIALEWVGSPLVTDGSRVYFQEGGIAQVSVTGGETVAILSGAPTPVLFDISPAGSELLVGRNSIDQEPPIEVLPLPTGARRRLSDLRGHDAAWSRDGQRFVFANASDVYTAKSDGTEAQKIVSAPSAVFWPRWSPDGKRVRFTVRDAETGSLSLWEVSRDGTALRPLLQGWNNPPAECCGNWTPDGKFFVFQSAQHGKTNIWALREGLGLLRFFRRGASTPVLLTTGGMNYIAPIVSRDSKQIFVKGAIPRGEVLRYEVNSGQFVPYPALEGISAEDVDFSKDGGWVTYVAYPERSLWRSKIDGSHRIQLTLSPMRVFLPRWSPDGRRIAFAASLPGQRWQIYVISAEGGRPEQMTDGKGDYGDVGWSPDGGSLLFGALGGNAETQMQISLLDLRTLRVSIVSGSQGLFSPRWSPDGRYIMAMPLEQTKLMLYDFRTKKWTERSVARIGFPSWSGDSKYVYFDTLSRDPAIIRIRISDGKAEKIADLKNLRRPTSSFGAWTGLTPDNSPLVLRDTGSQEIYAINWDVP